MTYRTHFYCHRDKQLTLKRVIKIRLLEIKLAQHGDEVMPFGPFIGQRIIDIYRHPHGKLYLYRLINNSNSNSQHDWLWRSIHIALYKFNYKQKVKPFHDLTPREIDLWLDGKYISQCNNNHPSDSDDSDDRGDSSDSGDGYDSDKSDGRNEYIANLEDPDDNFPLSHPDGGGEKKISNVLKKTYNTVYNTPYRFLSAPADKYYCAPNYDTNGNLEKPSFIYIPSE